MNKKSLMAFIVFGWLASAAGAFFIGYSLKTIDCGSYGSMGYGAPAKKLESK